MAFCKLSYKKISIFATIFGFLAFFGIGHEKTIEFFSKSHLHIIPVFEGTENLDNSTVKVFILNHQKKCQFSKENLIISCRMKKGTIIKYKIDYEACHSVTSSGLLGEESNPLIECN